MQALHSCFCVMLLKAAMTPELTMHYQIASSRGEWNIRCLDWIFNRAHFARNRLLHIVLSEL